MNGWSTRRRLGPVRLLVVVCLLAGVFAMHGLSADHDGAMVLRAGTDVAAATHQPATMAMPAGLETVRPASHEHRHGTGDVCMAILATLLVAIVAALALRSTSVWHPDVLARPVPRVPLADPVAQPPTLSKLCVLRT